MLVMSSLVSSFSAHDVSSVNTRVKREGSHFGPLTSPLNIVNNHDPVAYDEGYESDCHSSAFLSDCTSDASVAN